MSIDKTRSGILTLLFLMVMAFGISTGCSSSEESSSSGDCNCAEGDWNCQDACN